MSPLYRRNELHTRRAKPFNLLTKNKQNPFGHVPYAPFFVIRDMSNNTLKFKEETNVLCVFLFAYCSFSPIGFGRKSKYSGETHLRWGGGISNWGVKVGLQTRVPFAKSSWVMKFGLQTRVDLSNSGVKLWFGVPIQGFKLE